MTSLIKTADWENGTRLNVVFVHGLGGHAYDTWRQRSDNGTFWPAWLARDIPGVTTWTLAYSAPPSNWLGTAMPIQDRAKNVLECLLGQRDLRGLPLVFVCHSLGGLVVKQLLRAADARRAYGDAEARTLIDDVKGVVFIATPHTGSMQATLLDKLRLIAWPSASTLDLVKNSANLRDLNVWYRNWSGAIRNKVFYEKQGTAAGVIVADDSSDPGLLHVDPVGIDADHLAICKPTDGNDIVYVRTRDFVVDDILHGAAPGPSYGKFNLSNLPELKRSRPGRLVPIALRLSALVIVGLIAFKGLESIFFPSQLIDQASVSQIIQTLRTKSPSLTPEQIDLFIQALREARGDPSLQRAIDEAKKGNARVAEGIWLQIYENRKKEQRRAQSDQAEAARNLAASAAINSATQSLTWYRDAVNLDPDNLDGWLGLGIAAKLAGTLQESARAFNRYISLARNDGELAVGHMYLGDVLLALGSSPEALKSYRDSLAIADRATIAEPGNTQWQQELALSEAAVSQVLTLQGNLSEALKSARASLTVRERLAATEPGNTQWQRDLGVAYGMVGDVLLVQDDWSGALKSYSDSLAIKEHLAKIDPGNTQWQYDLGFIYDRLGRLLMAQRNLSDALKYYRDSLAIAKRIAEADPGNTEWQRELSVAHEKVGNVLIAQGKLSDGLISYQNSLAIRDHLNKADPDNAQWRNDLSRSYIQIGEVLVAQANLPDALKSYRDGLAIRMRLAKDDSSNTEFQHGLAIAHQRIGDALRLQHSLPDALISYREALAIIERLAAADPGNTALQWDLAQTDDKVGYVLGLQGSLDGALKCFRDSVALQEGLAKRDHKNTQWQSDLAGSYVLIGDALIAQGNLPDALKSYRSNLAIREDLSKADPGNMQWQSDLFLSYDKVGEALVAQGYSAEALNVFRDSVALMERLVISYPETTKWQAGLILSLVKAGRLSQPADARAALTRALSLAESLSRAGKLVGVEQSWPQLIRDELTNIH